MKYFQNILPLRKKEQCSTASQLCLSNIMLFCFVLFLFLAGSCKTSELSKGLEAEEYSLLPKVESRKYTPAKGYSHTARRYISHNPDALMHMTEMQVKYILGSPEIKWQENPAEVWQYRSKKCTLDVYFYNEDLSNDLFLFSHENNLGNHRKVSYYEMRQLGRPSWATASGANDGYLPSKIRDSNRVESCIDNIVNRSS